MNINKIFKLKCMMCNVEFEFDKDELYYHSIEERSFMPSIKNWPDLIVTYKCIVCPICLKENLLCEVKRENIKRD